MSLISTTKAIFSSLEIIEKRINEKITIESIAAGVYISKFHYMRLFREIVGDSVMDYVIKRKLSLAANELLETNISILDIALSYGYDSRDGFSRSFKAFTGMTPAQYRKHRSSSTNQKSGKEKEYKKMDYSKTTDAIIREINEWISQANDLAIQIRKANRYGPEIFWSGVSDQTEDLANNFLTILNKISSITQNPDEISTGMDIIKSIDDTVFVIHCIAIQIEMIEAKISDRNAYELFEERYRSLAWSGIEKTKKISEFLRELLLLVLKDMRITVGEFIQDIVGKGKCAASSIPEKLTYIRDEIIQLTDVLSTTPIELITVQMLDDSYFKMKLIIITAKLNINESDSIIFENLQCFLDALSTASSFCGTIVKPIENPPQQLQTIKVMQDIVYMENVLFFYTLGELDSLCNELAKIDSNVKREDLSILKAKINVFRKTAFFAERDESDISVFQNIADRTNEIVSDLHSISNKLGIQGNALKVIADELGRLATKTMQLVNDYEESVTDGEGSNSV